MATQSILEKAARPIPAITNALLFLAGAACLIKGVLSLWTESDPTATALGLAAGLVLLLASSIERFEVLKGLGVEARTRELKQTIIEANATLSQLRELATSICHVVISDLMASNFMGGISLEQKVRMHDDLIMTLKQLGVASTQVGQADSKWREGIGLIYHRMIKKELMSKTTDGQISPAVFGIGGEFQEMLDFDEWRAPSPDAMEIFLKSRDQMTPTLQEFIDDYRHYLTHGVLRRPQVFFKG